VTQQPMSLLTLAELLDATGGRLRAEPAGIVAAATLVGRVMTDSRHVTPGDLYWARPGGQDDDRASAQRAFARGAAGVVAAHHVVPPTGRWSVQVHDSQLALWQLASAARQQFRGRVVAVTGSVGKTTVRQMIHTVLSNDHHGVASPHNFNNQMGVPLSMLAWQPNHHYAVLELGATRQGEIDALAALCRPEIGIVTCVGPAHLAGLGSQKAVAESKAELFAALPADGYAILSADDPWTEPMRRRCHAQLILAGRSADADIVATNVNSGGGRLRFEIQRQTFEIPVWGRHYLTSALAAIAVGRLFGQSLPAMAAALGEFQALPQRCQINRQSGITIINDTCNASPMAMQAALELLRDFPARGRRVVICGDLLDLGPTAEQWHEQLGQNTVTTSAADLLIACGRHARQVVTGARDAGMPMANAVACRLAQDALPLVAQRLTPGDVVLVKGSCAEGMERIISAIGCQSEAAQNEGSDREIMDEAMHVARAG
jgi:UDP-N-acetylmuramoyl-tripeptide--D-alanyl-D-alanine ligase